MKQKVNKKQESGRKPKAVETAFSDEDSRRYQAIRIGLIEKGTNLNRWAAAEGEPFTTVYDAAAGKRKGIKAIQIKRKLEEYING